jgi:hypothetical protein
MCRKVVIIRYSEISLSRKTTNQRDDNKLSYFRKTTTLKALNFTKPVEGCVTFLRLKLLYIKYEDLILFVILPCILISSKLFLSTNALFIKT